MSAEAWATRGRAAIATAKWMLVAFNLFLFCLSLHQAAHIAFSNRYSILGGSLSPIYVNEWVFMAECAAAATVFAAVTWRPLAAPAGWRSLALLAAAPTAFFLIFGPLVGNMM
ncbi:MAG: hypothetical protein HKM95_10440 [Inquilinus sp.]|nr:hypothetical protein [Inquilinus sp.]